MGSLTHGQDMFKAADAIPYVQTFARFNAAGQILKIPPAGSWLLPNILSAHLCEWFPQLSCGVMLHCLHHGKFAWCPSRFAMPLSCIDQYSPVLLAMCVSLSAFTIAQSMSIS